MTDDMDASVAFRYELVAIVREALGIDERAAAAHAERIARVLQLRFGGDELYIPAPSKAERNAAIRAEFNGRNADEICRRHNVSRSRLYQIVADR